MKEEVTLALDERMYARLKKLTSGKGDTIEEVLTKLVAEAINKRYQSLTPNSSKGVCNDK